jgi:hypothetical protein
MMLAVVALWVRSYFVQDIVWIDRPGYTFLGQIATSRGKLVVGLLVAWRALDEIEAGNLKLATMSISHEPIRSRLTTKSKNSTAIYGIRSVGIGYSRSLSVNDTDITVDAPLWLMSLLSAMLRRLRCDVTSFAVAGTSREMPMRTLRLRPSRHAGAVSGVRHRRWDRRRAETPRRPPCETPPVNAMKVLSRLLAGLAVVLACLAVNRRLGYGPMVPGAIHPNGYRFLRRRCVVQGRLARDVMRR